MTRACTAVGAQGLFEKLRTARHRYNAACVAANKAKKRPLLSDTCMEDESRARLKLLEKLNELEIATEELLESLPNYRWEQELRLLYYDDCQVAGIAQIIGVHRRTVYRDLNRAFVWMDNEMKLNRSV